MKPVVIKRDGCRAPFNAALIAEAVNRAARLVGLDIGPMVISIASPETISPFYYVGTIKDLECSGLIIPDTILGGTVATMT